MNQLLIGLLGALIATNQPVAVSNLVAQTTGITIKVPDPNDPVEKEYAKLLADDNAAQAEVDRWIQEMQAAEEKKETKPGSPSPVTLSLRIEQRFDPVRRAYEDFLRRHPDHARARLAYGSFLGDIGDEKESVVQWEKSRQLDPSNPAVWNNLANHYGHRGGIQKAFEYYAKAIELNPREPVYYQNLATSVYLFRKDAREYYQMDEQQVFDRALELYRKALKLDPTNFLLATDYAQCYYGIKPTRFKDAMEAWNYAMKIARDEVERQGVYIHLARFQINAGHFAEARKHLDQVVDPMYAALKERVTQTLQRKEQAAQNKAAPPSSKPSPQ